MFDLEYESNRSRDDRFDSFASESAGTRHDRGTRTCWSTCNTTSFEFAADGLTAELGGVIVLTTGALNVRIDENENVVAIIEDASLTLDAIQDSTGNPISVDLDGDGENPALIVRRDGLAPGDLTATFTSDGGLVSTLGLGEIIPLEVDQITAFFNDADGDGVLAGAAFIPSLSVRGTIESDFFQQPGNGGFEPFVIVGDLPVSAGGDVVTIDDIVEFLDGTPVANVIDSINHAPTETTKAVPGVTEFQFGVAIVGGRILPFDIPQISIGFTGLDLGVVEAAGFLGLGAYADRQSVLDGNPAFTAEFAGGIAITSTVEGLDGNASISLQGEFRPGSESIDSELEVVGALAELSFSTPASLPGFQLAVQDAAAQFEMLVSINDDFEFSLDTLALSQASVGSVTATFGGTLQSDGSVTDPLLRLAATGISLDLRDMPLIC